MSFYKMYRGWQDSEMFSRAEYDDRAAWAWMVGEARWSDGFVSAPNGSPVLVRRGQLYTSIRFMAEKFGWSKDRVARTLKRFERWGAIRAETATGQNLITICKYEEYQGGEDAPKDGVKDRVEDAPKDAPKDKQEEDQRKERKEEHSLSKSTFPEDWFEGVFWKHYPKQRAGAKSAARKAMAKALTKTTKEKITDGLRNYTKSDEVARGYAKGAAAWLNDERWTSDYRPHGQRNQQKASYLDKIQNAGARASDIVKARLEAESAQPWGEQGQLHAEPAPLRLTQRGGPDTDGDR
jgi:hypothetical protein